MREGGDGVEGLSKMVEGFMDMDNSVVIVGEGGIRGLNDNRKKYNKDKIKIILIIFDKHQEYKNTQNF